MDHPSPLPWLLVATPKLTDPNFHETVVLIVEHTDSGALGFVLNRPLPTPLATLVKSQAALIPADVAAWYGGPVGPGSGVILHDRTEPAQRLGTRASFTMSSSEETLISLAAFARERLTALALDGPNAPAVTGPGLYPFRFLTGYAGWGEGQLQEELQDGAWLQVRATWSLLFNTDWRMLWDAALGTVGTSARRLAPAAGVYLN